MLSLGIRGLSCVIACTPVALAARSFNCSSVVHCQEHRSVTARRAQHIFTDSQVFRAFPNEIKSYVLQHYDSMLEGTGMAMYKQLTEKLHDNSADALEVVFASYLPIYGWIMYLRQHHQQGSPLVIGLSAPQGCGKTTLVEHLQAALADANLQCAALSLDDLYRTATEQATLAQGHPSNSLLKFRGNAGTHDLKLATEVLQQLKDAKQGQTVRIPRFDKSVNNGRGDRAPTSMWPTVQGPLDVILLEGWMLGFEAVQVQDEAELNHIHSGLQEVNRFLSHYNEIYQHMNAWIVMQVHNLEMVYQWRLQAEQRNSRLSGRPGMTDDEVKDFVDRFMPAYEAYLPKLYVQGPPCYPDIASRVPVLKVRVSEDRSISNAVCFSVCDNP